MKPIIALIDSIMIHEGRKTLRFIDKSSLQDRPNEAQLLKILHDNKDTEYGRKYDFGNIHSFEEYKAKVPLSNYDDYQPYIQRMIKSKEDNLITSYKVLQYADTSGSVGVQKKIPVTDKMINIHKKYSFCRTKAMADIYWRKKYGKPVPHEFGLNTVECENTVAEDGKIHSSATGSVARRYRRIFKYFLTSPDPIHFPIGGMNMNYMKARFALDKDEICFMLSPFMTNIVDVLNFIKNHWEILCDDIENGTINPDMCEEKSRPAIMKYIKKNPRRAQQLREIFKQGFDTPIIPRLWPKMSWACAIGNGSFASYCKKYKKYAGDKVAIDYFVYAASEGMFACAIEMNKPEFCLLTDSCFFEFRDPSLPDDCNDTLMMDQLEVGKEYEVIITNLGGFYRYKIQDVIRVLGFHNNLPLITFAYRKGQLANIAAEKTTEEHLNEAVTRLGKELNVDFTDFTLYLDTDSAVSKYVMLLEPDTPIDIDRDGKYSEAFRKIIREVNKEYADVEDCGSLDKPLILIQQQETHALWREYKLMKGSSSNQVKPVRMLDVPIKQKFFFGLLEPGQKVPNWNVYTKKNI